MLLFLMIILMEQKASGNCLNKTIERVNEGLTPLAYKGSGSGGRGEIVMKRQTV